MSADRMKHLGRIRDALDNNNFEDEVDIIDRMIAEEAASVRTPKKRRVSRAACSVDAGAVALHRPSVGNRYKFRGSGNPTSDRMRGIVGSGLQAASSLIALIHVLRHAWGVGLAPGPGGGRGGRYSRHSRFFRSAVGRRKCLGSDRWVDDPQDARMGRR
jgi:hypothetical protein